MDCPKPKCRSKKIVLNGNVWTKGKTQRYKCKKCGHTFTVTEVGFPSAIKRLAMTLYLEGLSFSVIGRLFNVSEVAVLQWVKKFCLDIKKTRKNPSLPQKTKVQKIDLDEARHLIKKKYKNPEDGILITNTEGLPIMFFWKAEIEKEPLEQE